MSLAMNVGFRARVGRAGGAGRGLQEFGMDGDVQEPHLAGDTALCAPLLARLSFSSLTPPLTSPQPQEPKSMGFQWDLRAWL